MSTIPYSERINISFFGAVNSGKSSLMNAITSQNVSIVSDIEGTTTDPVRKTMEILPLGAVELYDTAGFDDNSPGSELRIKKTLEILRKTDLAILVTDKFTSLSESEVKMIRKFTELNIPYIVVHSKSDLIDENIIYTENEISVSAKTGDGIEELKKLMCSIYLSNLNENKPQYKSVTDGLVERESVIVLVTPIDNSAPKARLILPQVQTLRSLLDSFAITVVVQPSELCSVLKLLKRLPDLVITDSQVFSFVKDIIPENVPLTSFSILMARYKGILPEALKGIEALKNLKDDDCVLISEGCSHHRQCGDIARDKLPVWIKKFTGRKLCFEFTSGGTFPVDIKKYSLIVHCGGCMLSSRELEYRQLLAKALGIPFTNYGILIAAVNGILDRSVKHIKERKI